jgi:hypothetical protein
MQLTPVASASPNGDFRVQRRYRRLPPQALEVLEAAEEAHQERVIEDVSERGIYRRPVQAVSSGERVSSRRAVIAEHGGLEPRCAGGCTCRSRSHELHKSQLRLERRQNRG